MVKLRQMTRSMVTTIVAMCLALLGSWTASAQSARTITGYIVDASSLPVAGASVIIKGTQNGVISDDRGAFSIDVPSDASTLEFSFYGFKTVDVDIAGKEVINVTMQEDVTVLDAVVAVGYATQKRVNMTGSVASISTGELEGKPLTNAIEGLQGTTPGFIVRQDNSSPGSAPSMNIRGLNTMNNNDPLVIIDGIEGNLANVNPADIDQISILKDASSTAIYGSRASNGVVLITTKHGKEGQTNVTYNFNYGLQQPTCLPNVVDSWVYAELYNEAAVNSGRSTKFTAEDIAGYRNGGTNVKWIRELYKEVAPQQSHNVSMTGGSEKMTYMASLGYLDQDSMFKGPDYGYKRYNARLNMTHKVNDRLTLDLTSAFTRNKIREHAYWTNWIIEQANRMPAIYEIKNPDGTYNYPSGSNSNALQRLEQGGYRGQENDDISGNLKAEFEILDGWKLIGSAGGRLNDNLLHENRKAFEGTGDAENHIKEESYRSKDITINLMTTYNKSWGKHNIGLLAGYSYEGFTTKSFSTQRITDDSKYDILVGDLSGDKVSNNGGASDWSMYSGFARFTYNYAEKYLLELNVRNDYSSYFSKNNRSGVFPSLSAGWRLSEEEWWNNVRPYVSSFKLRGSYGLLGNNRIGAYQYMQTVSVLNGISFGNVLAPTVSFSSANPDIKWETTSMTDIGFDAGFLKNSLNVTFDWYNNYTKDILVNLPVPGLFGNGAPVQNAGVVRTTGWEFALNYHFKTGEMSHDFAANVSDSRNVVVDVQGQEIITSGDVNTIIKEGYPLNSYYAYRSDGFFQNEEECAAGPHLDGITPKPGDIRYIDKNGDGLIKEDDDRFVVGNDFPRYLFGISYGFQFKGFSFSMFWNGVGKRSRWMRGESVEAFHNNNEGPLFDFHIDRWTPENTDASYPRLTMGSESANNAAKSDFWIQDASYLRLKNVKVGYTIPQSLVKKVGLKEFTIYASADNVLTFTKMKGGWDPEYNGDGSGRQYPLAKVFSLGVNVKF